MSGYSDSFSHTDCGRGDFMCDRCQAEADAQQECDACGRVGEHDCAEAGETVYRSGP